MIAPIYKQLSTAYPQAVFVEADVDRLGRDACRSRGAAGLPTFQFYLGKQMEAAVTGAGDQARQQLMFQVGYLVLVNYHSVMPP